MLRISARRLVCFRYPRCPPRHAASDGPEPALYHHARAVGLCLTGPLSSLRVAIPGEAISRALRELARQLDVTFSVVNNGTR